MSPSKRHCMTTERRDDCHEEEGDVDPSIFLATDTKVSTRWSDGDDVSSIVSFANFEDIQFNSVLFNRISSKFANDTLSANFEDTILPMKVRSGSSNVPEDDTILPSRCHDEPIVFVSVPHPEAWLDDAIELCLLHEYQDHPIIDTGDKSNTRGCVEALRRLLQVSKCMVIFRSRQPLGHTSASDWHKVPRNQFSSVGDSCLIEI